MGQSERQLTWKYFRQQKYEEILAVIKVIIFVSLFVGWMIGGMCLMFAYEGLENNEAIYNGNWWAFIPIVLWACLVICAIIYQFIYWLTQNWIKAKKRAQKELAPKKKVKGRNSK